VCSVHAAAGPRPLGGVIHRPVGWGTLMATPGERLGRRALLRFSESFSLVLPVIHVYVIEFVLARIYLGCYEDCKRSLVLVGGSQWGNWYIPAQFVSNPISFVLIVIKLFVDIILLCCFMFGLLFMYGIRTPGKLGGSGRLREVPLVCTLPPFPPHLPNFYHLFMFGKGLVVHFCSVNYTV
jgi:hypothetical protein